MANATKAAQFTQAELLPMIKDMAVRLYDKKGAGWDILVECHSDEEILGAMGSSRTLEGAAWAVRKNLGIFDQAAYRDEIRATAW